MNFFKWRLIGAKVTTVDEFDRCYSLIDALDAHEYLDIKQEAEKYYSSKLDK